MKAITNESRLSVEQARDRLFAGVFPTGISYADKGREEHGDYARLAFLSFDTLDLKFEANCPAPFRDLITDDAASIQAKRGQDFQVSTAGQTILLGPALKPARQT